MRSPASRRRGRATALVLAGWVLAIPACVLVMADPRLGVQEYPELKALVQGRDALGLATEIQWSRARSSPRISTRA